MMEHKYPFSPGPYNQITDVNGLTIGEAHDEKTATGVTVFLFEEPATASVCFAGGGPANRDTACLEPDAAVETIDALVLSGGSGFGLDAASGVQAWLRENNRGLPVGPVKVPIVPQAIIFDLLNGGNKEWGRFPPYRELAYEAACRTGRTVTQGSAGAGFGATTVNFKGGSGSTSIRTPSGFTIGAYAVVNSLSSAVIGNGPYFWAAPYELNGEFGGLGMPASFEPDDIKIDWKGKSFATTIAVLATDARLTKAQAKRLSIAAQGGLAKALRLSHGFMDGDTLFFISTGKKNLTDIAHQMTELGSLASDCLARSVARGVFEASSLPFQDAQKSWKDVFG